MLLFSLLSFSSTVFLFSFLFTADGELEVKLSAANAKSDVEKFVPNAETFAWKMCQDEMAHFKVRCDGI